MDAQRAKPLSPRSSFCGVISRAGDASTYHQTNIRKSCAFSERRRKLINTYCVRATKERGFPQVQLEWRIKCCYLLWFSKCAFSSINTRAIFRRSQNIQGSAKERSLGCVKRAPTARVIRDMGITQPKDHYLADPCINGVLH